MGESINILVIPCTEWLKGSKQRLHHLSEMLHKKNRVYVFYLERSDATVFDSSRIERLKYSIMIRIPTIRSKNIALLHTFNFFLQLIYLVRTIKSAKIDVLITEGVGTSNAALIAAKIMNRRIVFDYCDSYAAFAEMYVSNNLVRKLSYVVASFLTNVNVRFSDATVVVSDGLFVEGEKYAKRIHKIVNGVSEDCFPSNQERHVTSDNVVVGFVGSVEPWVSFENLISAIVNLNKAGAGSFSLRIVGAGSKLRGLREYVDRHQLSETVDFRGWVTYTKLHEYINEFDICVLPFDTSSISVLSMPMKIHEYAICKKPIISTPLPEIKKLYGSSVLYASTTQEYMKCIRLLLEDMRTRSKNVEDAYQIAQKHSWKILSKEYEKILFDS